MVDPIDDIARQARQGSVSAIIQVLNEKLSDSGVRTRAMFSQGVLQLLCEAASAEQLTQSELVPRVKKILESLQPRNIRRVNINSRIVREQQLLWLDEINRDPDGQLLWSEEIRLDQPGFLQRLNQTWKDGRPESKTTLPKASPVRIAREKRVFWRGLLGGASLSLFLLILGWALYGWLQPKSGSNVADQADQAQTDQANSSIANATTGASDTNATSEPFSQAVRLAEEAAAAGQTAKTSADWLAIAAKWQQASDLMSQVPADNDRHPIAQDRVKVYQQNSEAAAQQADKQR